MRKVSAAVSRAVISAIATISAALLLGSPARAGDEIVDPLAPGHGGIPAAIDETDAIAALQGINIALSEVGDGGTYVWHRQDGLLSGMAQPSASFKGVDGMPCRHLVVMLNGPGRDSKIDGIACRIANGQWQLAG